MANDDFNMNDDLGDFEDNFNFTPQNLDSNTFKQRNDPSDLLYRYKLQLMNAFVVEVETEDEDGRKKKTKKVRQRKGTVPKANKEGIEDIISYIETFINSHIVQSNLPSMNDYNDRMMCISQDITKHFIEFADKWGLSISDVDLLIRKTVNLVDLFLTRALFNEERKGYGEAFKETTHKEIRNEDKPNLLQKFGSMLSGGKR